ncbi:hypothetical protein WR25_20058 [Diploscapter pachys]|uniref:Major facilitator superfamily (MFS) profile domain-containing protein n=1 Tax=Diploscapter pachys TaxID=2018661 RepID=A0A2A2LUZ6_9BILA|nr:hypothetical protein WR25_20058 [Diploscapter pachys]
MFPTIRQVVRLEAFPPQLRCGCGGQISTKVPGLQVVFYSSSKKHLFSTYNPYDYSVKEKSYIIWAVSAGAIVGTFPVNYFYIKYGARWPFFIAGILSAFSTISVPLAAKTHLVLLLFVRFIQRWAPLAQTGTFIAVLTSFTPMSSVITNPVAGWLCVSSWGWRSAYYIFGIFTLISFLFWIYFYTDDPQFHKSVSQKELGKIQKDKTEAHIKRDSFIPYKEIITNKTILVIWLNAFTEMVTAVLLLTYSPLYFRNVLKFDVEQTGLLVSASASVHLPLKLAFGFMSDYITCISEIWRMRFFNTIAVGVAGVFCLLIGIVPAEYRYTEVALFCGVLTAMGLNPGGFYKCGTLASRQYSHVVLGAIQFMKCVALFVAPLWMAIFVHDEYNYHQWKWVFICNGVLCLLANVLFYPIVTDQPEPFTLITRETRMKEKQMKLMQNGHGNKISDVEVNKKDDTTSSKDNDDLNIKL